MVALVLSATLLQSFLMVWYYSRLNSNPRSNGGPLLYFINLFDVFGATVSKVYLLLFALIREQISEHVNKIRWLSLVYFLSTCVSIYLHKSKQDYEMNTTWLVVSELPHQLATSCFIIWTCIAFWKTLSYLETKKIEHKIQVFKTLFGAYIVVVFGAVIIGLDEIINGRSSSNRDIYWEEFDDILVFPIVLTLVYTIVVMVVLPPCQNTSKFEEIEELLDDTLTTEMENAGAENDPKKDELTVEQISAI